MTTIESAATQTDQRLLTAAYIGRFQPPHNGHVEVVDYIMKQQDVGRLIFIIGSAQYDYRKKSKIAPWAINPFTVDEREEMLRGIFGSRYNATSKPVDFVQVPDYHNYPKWWEHIQQHVPPFTCVFTSDKKETEFFGGKGIIVRGFPRRNGIYHAGIIREMMTNNDRRWRTEVPPQVVAMSDRVDVGRRLRDLYAKDIAEKLCGAAANEPPIEDYADPEEDPVSTPAPVGAPQ